MPRVMLLPHFTANCNVHFKLDTFFHNDHNGYVHLSTNLTEKMFSHKNDRLIFINLRLPVLYSPYSPADDSSNILMYKIYSWKAAIYDWKITAIIIYIGSTLGNIYRKYAIVYYGYHLHLIAYICWLTIMFMINFWCKMCNAFITFI